MFVMGLIGDVAAGKGTSIKIFLEAMSGCKIITLSSSDVLLEMLNEKGLEPSRENFNKMVEQLQKNGGPGALSRLMGNLIIEQVESDIVIWDGVRLWPDVEIIEGFNRAMLVYVTADVSIRHQRAMQRARPGEASISLEQFIKNEDLPTNRHVKNIGRIADFTINNSLELDSLKRQVERLAKKLKEKNLVSSR
ncbi:MAG: hypothetical protein FJZ43_01280 [Candidatus Staskawiczbacteria bacterium]|nr:hypothetical protein [Candidatus Staskawiczbacteria bacterium]